MMFGVKGQGGVGVQLGIMSFDDLSPAWIVRLMVDIMHVTSGTEITPLGDLMVPGI